MLKEDYQNVLKLLERVEVKGLAEARYIAVLAHKLETRVATWFDGHETGFKQDVAEVEAKAKEATNAIEEKAP